MTRFCVFVGMAAMAAGMVTAQDAAPKSAPAEQAPAAKTPPLDDEARDILQNVQKLQAEQKYFEALQALEKLEAKLPDSPVVANMQGSIYTSMRDFAKARGCFELSLKRQPGTLEPKFNLAELLYAEAKYPEAEAAFSALLKEFPKLREEVRHLTQFKVAVCRLKQNHFSEAEEIMKNFTFMDDTPAYYFANAAVSFQKGNKPEAQSWMEKAQRIFKGRQNAPYIDSLMEAQWVPSISVPNKGTSEAK